MDNNDAARDSIGLADMQEATSVMRLLTHITPGPCACSHEVTHSLSAITGPEDALVHTAKGKSPKYRVPIDMKYQHLSGHRMACRPCRH